MVSSKLLPALLALGTAAHAARVVPERPDIKPSPFQPYKAFPESTPRDPNKVCFVKPSCTEGGNDAPKILAAFEKCNDGGTIVLDENYTICSPLDLRFLKHVDVAITGHLKFCDDVDYWAKNTFRYQFQNASSSWVWGGKDVNIYGNGQGIIDGNGQAWYDRFASDPLVHRPHLFLTDGLHGATITGLKMRNSPNVCARLQCLFEQHY